MQRKPSDLRNANTVTKHFLFWAATGAALLSGARTAQAEQPPFITATPNPVPAGTGQGSTLLRWNAGTNSGQVFLAGDRGKETLFAGSPRGQQQADWINSGGVYEFRLYQGENREKLVAKVQVTRVGQEARRASHIDVGAIALLIVLLTLGAVAAWAVVRRFQKHAPTTPGPAVPLETAGLCKPIPARLVVLCLVSLLSVLLAVNVWWMTRFRAGYPININEAQFLADGFDQADAARTAGAVGLWERVQQPSWHAPLLPLIVALGSLVFGKSLALSLAVVQVFFILLVLSAYGVGKQSGDARTGLLVVGIMATSHGAWFATRSFYSTIPTVALFTAALFCLMRSRGLRGLGWSVAFGLLVGLTALMRSVSVALLPGLFLAGGCQLLTIRGDRARRLWHLVLAGFLALGVAATWYGNNYESAWQYLAGYGYGAQSAQYSKISVTTPWQFCTFRFRVLIDQEFHAPLGLTLAAVMLVAAGVATWRSMRHRRVLRDLRAFSASSHGLLLINAGFSYAVLTSSRNEGSGLMLFLVPPLAALAAAAICAAGNAYVRKTATGLVAVICLFNALSGAGVMEALSMRRWIFVPTLGYLAVTDGRATIQHMAENVGCRAPVTQPPVTFLQWSCLNDEILDCIHRRTQGDLDRATVLLGLHGVALNFATLRVGNHLGYDKQAEWLALRADSPSMEDLIRASHGHQGERMEFLITGELGPDEFSPPIDQAKAEAIARESGYRLMETLRKPDHRTIRIWQSTP